MDGGEALGVHQLLAMDTLRACKGLRPCGLSDFLWIAWQYLPVFKVVLRAPGYATSGCKRHDGDRKRPGYFATLSNEERYEENPWRCTNGNKRVQVRCRLIGRYWRTFSGGLGGLPGHG